MKTIEELRKTPRLQLADVAEDGGAAAAYLLSSKKSRPAFVIYSTGGGWDHVSASFARRTPTWEEMCEIKSMFFRPDETVIEYHPASDQYVNFHPYTLHLWRPQNERIPTPPSWMVGPREGQSYADAIREGMAALGGGFNG